MAELELPAVAKTIHLPCKKCEVDRYFIVVAHTSPTSAKVKCEVCGSSKTYKLPALKKATLTKSGAVKKPRATRVSKAGEHRAEYEKMIASKPSEEPTKYNMKLNFPKDAKVDHSKFGLGVVKVVHAEKIEVVFQDEVRSLVHNRV